MTYDEKVTAGVRILKQRHTLGMLINPPALLVVGNFYPPFGIFAIAPKRYQISA